METGAIRAFPENRRHEVGHVEPRSKGQSHAPQAIASQSSRRAVSLFSTAPPASRRAEYITPCQDISSIPPGDMNRHKLMAKPAQMG